MTHPPISSTIPEPMPLSPPVCDELVDDKKNTQQLSQENKNINNNNHKKKKSKKRDKSLAVSFCNIVTYQERPVIKLETGYDLWWTVEDIRSFKRTCRHTILVASKIDNEIMSFNNNNNNINNNDNDNNATNGGKCAAGTGAAPTSAPSLVVPSESSCDIETSSSSETQQQQQVLPIHQQQQQQQQQPQQLFYLHPNHILEHLALCIRGLETKTELGSTKRKLRRMVATVAVFEEQCYQWECNMHDPESLANTYRQCSELCRQEAYQRGLEDQQYVRDFVRMDHHNYYDSTFNSSASSSTSSFFLHSSSSSFSSSFSSLSSSFSSISSETSFTAAPVPVPNACDLSLSSAATAPVTRYASGEEEEQQEREIVTSHVSTACGVVNAVGGTEECGHVTYNREDNNSTGDSSNNIANGLDSHGLEHVEKSNSVEQLRLPSTTATAAAGDLRTAIVLAPPPPPPFTPPISIVKFLTEEEKETHSSTSKEQLQHMPVAATTTVTHDAETSSSTRTTTSDIMTTAIVVVPPPPPPCTPPTPIVRLLSTEEQPMQRRQVANSAA